MIPSSVDLKIIPLFLSFSYRNFAEYLHFSKLSNKKFAETEFEKILYVSRNFLIFSEYNKLCLIDLM